MSTNESVPHLPTARELVGGAFKLAFFVRAPADQVSASWMQIFGMVLISLLPPLAFAAYAVGDEGHFDLAYLPTVLFHVPVMLIAATVVSYLVDRGLHVRTLLAAALLAWIVIDALFLGVWAALPDALDNMPAANVAFQYVPLAWLALALARFAISLAPIKAWRKVVVVAACLLFLALPLASLEHERSLWTMDWARKAARYAERHTERMAGASEEAFYRQPELLQRQLAEVKAQRQGVIDVYFVGIAGYGAQDVFMREVESVATIFRERFDADGHIVKLINNSRTLLSYPVASRTSLKATIDRLAAVMDRDEDVLVLFLTSHGSSDHQFSLQMWPLDFKPLTAASIRQVLDESGIKNRVVIISACYSGGFLPPLQGDGTLVIAAAAPNRNSFGCSNENDWTYFGKAYFDEALRQTTSFTRAFEAAKPLIAEREKKRGFEPSMPQMSEGEAIRAKLLALEKQLANPAAAAALPGK